MSKYSRFGAESVNAAAEPRDSLIFFLLRPASLTHMLLDERSHFLERFGPRLFVRAPANGWCSRHFGFLGRISGRHEEILLFFRTNYEVTEELRRNANCLKCEVIQQAEISVRH